MGNQYEENLAKSLDEIEAKAEEVLSKSEESEEVIPAEEEAEEEATPEEDVEKGLKPDDVSSEEDSEKEKDEDEEDEDEEDEDDDAEEGVKKSVVDEFLENETIAKSLDVSDFLSEFVKVNGGFIDDLREDINKSLETSAHTATILAKSFGAIMKSQEGLTNLVKSQAQALAKNEETLIAQSEIIKSLQDRLGGVEKKTNVRKSVATPLEKSFEHSAGISHAGEKKEISKSEKLEKLTNMAIEGKNDVTINDVVAYESTGQLRPELENLFN